MRWTASYHRGGLSVNVAYKTALFNFMDSLAIEEDRPKFNEILDTVFPTTPVFV